MKMQYMLISTILLVYSCEVFCGRSILMPWDENENEINEKSISASNARRVFKRDKRHLLVFGEGAYTKILTPVDLPNHREYHKHGHGIQLQMEMKFDFNYHPIPELESLWEEMSENMHHERRLFDEHGICPSYSTREFIYKLLEKFMDGDGKSGHQCLLKSICETAEHPIVRNSIVDEIVHLILTPNNDEHIEDDYKNSRIAGEKGAECAILYHCPYGHGLLDKFSFLA